jgi:hypothetical protein
MGKKYNCKNSNILYEKVNRRDMIARGAMLSGAGLFGASFTSRAEIPGLEQKGNIFNVKDFGASGKREEKATNQIRAAVEACTSAGGGTVYVPPGDYTVGTIQMKDNVNLCLEAGATFFLSQDKDDFIQGALSMIYAKDANNFAVTGRGTLNGLAQYEFVEMQGVDVEIVEEIKIARSAGVDMRRYYRTGMQTFMFVLNDCKNVMLEDISIINSPLWTVRLNNCDRVRIHGVYIYSDLEKGVNADGIDICSSRNVTISDSIIITADDSIVLKTPKESGQEGPVNVTENIVVTNCILSSSSTPLMIGTETFADVRHVLFNNCAIRNSNKGFGINVQDGATVHDIIFSNLTIETNRRHWNWWGSAEMCKFILKKREEDSKLGRIKDIIIDNIICAPRGTSTIKGAADQPLENFRISNIQMKMLPEDAKDKRTKNAMEIENVNGLHLADLTIDWDEEHVEEKWQSALVMKKVSDFEIVSFKGRQGLKNGNNPAIVMENTSDGLIRDSKAIKGCETFVYFKGTDTKEIEIRNNNLKKSRKGISFENEGLKKAVEIK